MAFFEDLGKKLSQAGQTAVQKTKEMTDIARINGAISDEEKKVNNNYFQIGKLYVAIHMADHESDFAGMIASIKESETKIRDYRQQLQDIKGVVKCEQCGAEVSGNVAFCSSCGTQMPKITTPAVDNNTVKCAECGAMVAKNMHFCTSCGKPIADAVQEQPTLDSEAGKLQSNNCPRCGAVVEQGMAFCSECGEKMN